ncbi:MAG: ABC transporter ATP-binding protein [bacterium]|nr:ABC transporter ATP-binding protein [bacterium]
MAVVQINQLSKVYPDKKGEVVAVQNITFSVAEGEIVGLLGVNGAGKTTTLRVIATMLKPTSGTVTVAGFDVVNQPEQVRAQLGFMTSSTGLYPRLTGREVLKYFAKLHGMETPAIEQRLPELIHEFALSEFIDRKCDKLSTGQKQRVNIARTAMHRPRLLVLDEPTAGLDVLGARSIVDYVRNTKSSGRSVLFSTHRMEEAEALCDRIVVIHKGRLVADGTISDLRAHTGTSELQGLFLKLIGE